MAHEDHIHFSDAVMTDLMRKASNDARDAVDRTADMCDCDEQKFKIYTAGVGGVLFRSFIMLREYGDSDYDAIKHLLETVGDALKAGLKGVQNANAKRSSHR